MEQKLTKAQAHVFIALAQQKAELNRVFKEILDAEAEQMELLRVHYQLAEGTYDLRQEKDGSLLLFSKEEEK